MLAKRTLLIGTLVFEQSLVFRPIGLTLRAAPALAARGHPRLTKAGNGSHVIMSNSPCGHGYALPAPPGLRPMPPNPSKSRQSVAFVPICRLWAFILLFVRF